MILAHEIALEPTREQERYFVKACGVARHAYNWALAEWKAEYHAGGKPNALKLKVRYNSIRQEQFPWSREVTKCASAGGIMNLGTAYKNFFEDLKKGKKARFPKFKKRGQKDSFQLWNDQFAVSGNRIRMPHIGEVKLREPLRFEGKILGAAVTRTAGRWFVSVKVDTSPEVKVPEQGTTVGIDLGIASLMALSTGETVPNPKPRRAHLKRQKKLQRQIARQRKNSNRQKKRRALLSKLHYRISNIRRDAAHKATTRLAENFEILCIEDLNVSGMVKNHALAGALQDAAFGEIRRQLTYKVKMRGGYLQVIDRFYPSSKVCSSCGCLMDALPLSIREWTCPHCDEVHDRDINAAINIKLVGQAMPKLLLHGAVATHGERGALALEPSKVKPPSMNRELNPEVYTSTF